MNPPMKASPAPVVSLTTASRRTPTEEYIGGDGTAPPSSPPRRR